MVSIKKLFKRYKSVGSITSSSRFLYKKMTSSIDFSQDIHIVEFGPGDGVFSDKLLKDITPNSKISLFETDENFFKLLEKKYKNESRVILYHMSASEIVNFFEKHSVDYIMSSLPLSFIEKHIVGDILKKAKDVLKPEGKFIQFQYFLRNKEQIKQHFSKIDYKFTPLNIPPAFVYVCNK